MSEAANPYQSPETAAVPEKSLAQGSITETMVFHLKKASPWLRFIGISGFIFSGLAVLSGFIFFPITTRAFSDIPGIEQMSGMILFLRVLSVVYGLGAAVLFFFLSLYLYRFGDKIRSYLATGMEQDLEMAFKNNSKYWKMMGILFIIGLAFVPVTLVSSIIVVVTTLLT